VNSEEHVFRAESGRLVTALTRIFGLANLALVEDVVQDTFCTALQVWRLRGVPENPSAWLMKAAKNRAIDLLRRERRMQQLLPELGNVLQSEWTLVPTINGAFALETIEDDLLRMMFSCCSPKLPEATQLALTLNVVCGFSAGEVASALLCRRPAIEKRIARGKRELAVSKHLFDLADAEFPNRLASVQRAIYLLFNEGYHGSAQAAVRVELCREAMRLGSLLLDIELVATPASRALYALMLLHAARLPARLDGDRNLVPLADQDRSRWDDRFIERGLAQLELAAHGGEVSVYHLEAAIAAAHCTARSVDATDWKQVVWLYDQLVRLVPSPVVALNRAIAVAYRDGPQRGVAEMEAISDRDRLAAYPFYEAAIGELELRVGNRSRARSHFEAAVALARNPTERRHFQARADASAEPL
jgi:RNA polymerase sigma factor (sigma-70 family)